MKKRYALLLLAGILPIYFGSKKLGQQKRDCEVYQGYRNNVDGSVTFVFDQVTLEERVGSAKYNLLGKPEMRDSLLNGNVIGETFCFDYLGLITPLRRSVLKTATKLRW